MYGRVQVDSLAGNTISRDRFEATTGWGPGSMPEKLILDAGCGGGRFSEIALLTGATVVGFDLISCVDLARENLRMRHGVLHLAQASVTSMPFQSVFDGVFCMGVLAHTPDPIETLRCLCDVLKPGGELAVDVYELPEGRRRRIASLDPQHWRWRSLLGILPHRLLLRFVRLYVGCLLSLDNKVVARIQRGGAVGRLLSLARRCVPVISNYSLKFPFLTQDQQRLWAEMNTFDGYSPKFTKRQTRATMRAWAAELGLEDIQVFDKPGCGDGTPLVLRGRKPAAGGTAEVATRGEVAT